MSDVKFTRGSDVKYTNAVYTAELEKLGWKIEAKPEPVPSPAEEPEAESKEALFAKAVSLGLEPDRRLGVAKLKELIEASKSGGE